jgi:hypothetical protein
MAPVDNQHLLLDAEWLQKKLELEHVFSQKKFSLEEEIRTIHASARKTSLLDVHRHLELGEAWLKKEEELRRLREKHAQEAKAVVGEQHKSEVDQKLALEEEIEAIGCYWKALMTEDVHVNDAKNTPIDLRRHLELAEALRTKEEQLKKLVARCEKCGQELKAKD